MLVFYITDGSRVSKMIYLSITLSRFTMAKPEKEYDFLFKGVHVKWLCLTAIRGSGGILL